MFVDRQGDYMADDVIQMNIYSQFMKKVWFGADHMSLECLDISTVKVQIVGVDLGSCSFALSTFKANYQEFKASHT